VTEPARKERVKEVIREVVKEVPVEVVKEVPVEVIKEVIKEVPTNALNGKYEEDLFFLRGQSELRGEEAFKLGRICQILKDNPDAKIHVTGYADTATGTPEINERLSAERAAIVAEMLRKAGVDPARIVTGNKGGDRDASASPESNRVAVCIVKP
jgi:OOP family OmpA-OmpF porin